MKIVSVLFQDGYRRDDLECKDKSLAQQHLAADCDINEILKKFEQTGLVTHVNERSAKYGDWTAVPDYQSALNIVKQADELFMTLPPGVRERFDNDAGKFVEFCGDSKNREEAAKLGLLKADVVVGGVTPKSGEKPVESPAKA